MHLIISIIYNSNSHSREYKHYFVEIVLFTDPHLRGLILGACIQGKFLAVLF